MMINKYHGAIMNEQQIIKLVPDNYNKCCNIWDMNNILKELKSGINRL